MDVVWRWGDRYALHSGRDPTLSSIEVEERNVERRLGERGAGDLEYLPRRAIVAHVHVPVDHYGRHRPAQQRSGNLFEIFEVVVPVVDTLPLGPLPKRDHRIVAQQDHGLLSPSRDVRPIVRAGSVTIIIARDAKTSDPYTFAAKDLARGRGEPDVLRPDSSYCHGQSILPLAEVVVTRNCPHHQPGPRRQP
jgi:hypothetical protein